MKKAGRDFYDNVDNPEAAKSTWRVEAKYQPWKPAPLLPHASPATLYIAELDPALVAVHFSHAGSTIWSRRSPPPAT